MPAGSVTHPRRRRPSTPGPPGPGPFMPRAGQLVTPRIATPARLSGCR
jgi:hypothetical protein